MCLSTSTFSSESASEFAEGLIPSEVPMLDHRFLLHIEIQPEGCSSFRSPIPEGLRRCTFNDPSRLSEIVKAISIAMNKGLFLEHPGTQAEIQPESNCFVAEPDRGFCQNPHDQADGFYE